MAKIFKSGNSAAVFLPADIMEQAGWRIEDNISVSLLVLEKESQPVVVIERMVPDSVMQELNQAFRAAVYAPDGTMRADDDTEMLAGFAKVWSLCRKHGIDPKTLTLDQ